jgi:hypothetical protein
MRITSGGSINFNGTDSTTQYYFGFNRPNSTNLLVNGGNNNKIRLQNSENDVIVLNSNGASFFNSGNVLIGTTTDSGEKLQVRNGLSLFELASGTNGAILKLGRSAGSYYWHLGISGATSNFEFYDNSLNVLSNINVSTGVYVPLSDKNKKKDFEPSILGLNEIIKLKPTLYRMLSDSSEMEKQLGFIAQEVKEFIPQAYFESKDFIGLNYNSIIPVLVNAIKELNEKIK